MRIPACVLALALAVASSPPAQAVTFVRCGHLLATDAKSWRKDIVVGIIGSRIQSVRPAAEHDGGVHIDHGDAWVIPGLIDLHTHVTLRPYDQAPWTDQVLKESLELRSMRAVRHAEATLRAGFVAIRDLGTEGAGLVDVALRQAVRDGFVLGPEVIATTRAIAATGCYGPWLPTVNAPKGAELVNGTDEVRRAVREQIAAGADWIKVYADYRRAAGKPATPTFSLEELQVLCQEARSAGVEVAAHATTDEGMRRAALAGVATIEHGGGASEETLRLLAQKGIVLCPCLAATEAIVRYAGHRGPVARRLNTSRVALQRARAAGVTIGCGSDAGVFAHGENARELELMVDYGMSRAEALAAATTIAADVLGRPDLGRVQQGSRGGLVVLSGDPLADISNLRRVRAVILTEGGDILGR